MASSIPSTARAAADLEMSAASATLFNQFSFIHKSPFEIDSFQRILIMFCRLPCFIPTLSKWCQFRNRREPNPTLMGGDTPALSPSPPSATASALPSSSVSSRGSGRLVRAISRTSSIHFTGRMSRSPLMLSGISLRSRALRSGITTFDSTAVGGRSFSLRPPMGRT